jgi:hypothetical protein
MPASSNNGLLIWGGRRLLWLLQAAMLWDGGGQAMFEVIN